MNQKPKSITLKTPIPKGYKPFNFIATQENGDVIITFYFHKNEPKKSLTLKEVARKLHKQ